MPVTRDAAESISESVRWAREVIAKRTAIKDTDEALRYAKALKGESRFDLARRVLALAPVLPTDATFVLVHQQIANCTYKDEDIPMPHRFHQALDVLNRFCNLATTEASETLGLAGAIYKRMWEYGGQRADLERSLAMYHKGYTQKPDDEGYVAINTAFVLDLLARQENRTINGIAPGVAQQRYAEADRIREEVLQQLTAEAKPKPSWWYCATVAEAALGLGKFAEVELWLSKGKEAPHQPWERASTSRQMAVLAQVQSERRGGNYVGDAYQSLKAGLGITEQALKSAFLGKVGLALSGGGFRASLFHIGMLAKLAELDVLRHVEVLSCVSGGSIVGAHYYLELKKRLEQRASLSQQDYIDLVQTVERQFLEGVQSNIRTRIGSSLFASLKMAVVPGYSRSSRAGELYEEKLYKSIDGTPSRTLNEMRITPAGTQQFSPKYDNWDRDSKVPILVINATTLNTGHNWQFTATWMGESPQAINGAIDAIPRLRRMYIDGRDDIPERFQKFRLGQAVAASAGVPGVFEPIVLRRVYPDRTVRLVDGGVHDNQGLASLFEQSCSVMLVSDASGQMREARNPGGGIANVALRTNSIQQARIREAQFDQLQALQLSGAISGAMFIHLTKELDAKPVPFAGARDQDEIAEAESEDTSYHVDRVLQKQLAEIRTDLDSFSDAEAYALMMSAYLMTERTLCVEKCAPTLPLKPMTAEWNFLRVRDAVRSGKPGNTRLKRLLSVSGKLAGKVWWQSGALKAVAIAGVLAVITALIVALLRNWARRPDLQLPTVGEITVAAAVVVALIIVRFTLDVVLQLQKRFGEMLLGLTLATVGLVAAWVHLVIFDQIYLWYGQWPEEQSGKPSRPSAIADPGSPRLTIKAEASQQAEHARTPIFRRILNLIPPPRF